MAADAPVEVLPQLKDFLDTRTEMGIRKYGEPLHTHNGRDAVVDAFEEAADLLQYLAQWLIERDGHLPGQRPGGRHPRFCNPGCPPDCGGPD